MKVFFGKSTMIIVILLNLIKFLHLIYFYSAENFCIGLKSIFLDFSFYHNYNWYLSLNWKIFIYVSNFYFWFIDKLFKLIKSLKKFLSWTMNCIQVVYDLTIEMFFRAPGLKTNYLSFNKNIYMKYLYKYLYSICRFFLNTCFKVIKH